MQIVIVARKHGTQKIKTFLIVSIVPWPIAQSANINKEDFLTAKKTVSAIFVKFVTGNLIYANF